jgi:type VI secretion system protein VasG
MITQDARALLEKANTYVAKSVEGAAGFTISRTHYEVSLEHLFLKFLEDDTGDLVKILRYFEINPGELEARLLATVEGFRTGNSGRPSFSPMLLTTLERAFLMGAVEFGQDFIRSGTVLVAALRATDISVFRPYMDLLEEIQLDELKRSFAAIVAGSVEDKPPTGRFARPRPGAATGEPGGPVGEGSALDQFTLNFTAAARAGEIDPILARDDEIRQMVDILTRRRKNNPILVGEAGVGKTALVEGLALRIVAGDIPSSLHGVELRVLDLGLLQAGAGVKGEFENRLKSVIAEIKESETPIVTFIDEAHTLIGAGGSAGQGDAANLLKPALARGELRTIAATTWSEYKKYFEKDPALARRFQLVKVDEPDTERATTMMRGIKGKFEESHKVVILDTAVEAAVNLSERYISGRQLPDKSVDLIDTACARVKIGLTSKPVVIDDVDRRIQYWELELKARMRDLEGGTVVDDGTVDELEGKLVTARDERAELVAHWEREQVAVAAVESARGGGATEEVSDEPAEEAPVDEAPTEESGGEPTTEVDDGETPTEEPPASTTEDKAAPVVEADEPPSLEEALTQLAEVQDTPPMIPLEVTPEVIASVVADWTGIPVGQMVKDQAKAVLELERTLGRRILGQDSALGVMAQGIRAAKAGLSNPNTPIGSFLLVGPSGVGKTEAGLGMAETLFGGERFLTTINMSEFMEAHTVSRLIGSPPGYVGYGEGGRLTEAVRQRPYSVVLLDEVEKSHPDVMNLFYQVFDKGSLADGEGRDIDFKNTVLIMTSNLATETIVDMCSGEPWPEPDELAEAIRPELSERFKPALLARMTIVPFFPLNPDTMRRIVDLKLAAVAARLRDTAKIELSTTTELADWIAERCTVEETGARNVEHVIQNMVLPGVSNEILSRMAEDQPISRIAISVGDDDSPSFELE